MKDVDRVLKPYRVNRPISVSIKPLDYLQDARAFALPGLGVWMLTAQLGNAERIADIGNNLSGNVSRSAFAEPTQ